MKQETINLMAISTITTCKLETKDWTKITWKQWNKKNCYVSNCIKNRFFVVKSYNTIVAVIDDQLGFLYELGKWSPTTSKQVTQLYNMSDTESYKTFGFSKLEHRFLVK